MGVQVPKGSPLGTLQLICKECIQGVGPGLGCKGLGEQRDILMKQS